MVKAYVGIFFSFGFILGITIMVSFLFVFNIIMANTLLVQFVSGIIYDILINKFCLRFELISLTSHRLSVGLACSVVILKFLLAVRMVLPSLIDPAEIIKRRL